MTQTLCFCTCCDKNLNQKYFKRHLNSKIYLEKEQNLNTCPVCLEKIDSFKPLCQHEHCIQCKKNTEMLIHKKINVEITSTKNDYYLLNVWVQNFS